MFKKLLTTFTVCAICATFAALAEDLAFIGVTDKNPLQYDCNEKMTFTVTLVDRENNNSPVTGRTLKWQRLGDDGKHESGTASSDTPLVINTAIDRPGFVRLIVEVLDSEGKVVTGDKHKFDGGAGANVDKISGEPLPEGFDAFWDAEVKRLYETPYEVSLTPVEWPDADIQVYKFSITTFPGERPATGLMGYPKNAQSGSLKMVVESYGYGFGRYWVNANEIRKGKIYFTLARHGEDPIQEQKYYDELQKNEMKSFCFRNNDDLKKNDFYKMIMRDLRALQFAKSRQEWNKHDILVQGGSMGGFQSIALAALDHDVTNCFVTIPWMCDLAGGAKNQRMGGWRPASTETLRFFDTTNLATRVKCPVSMVIGLGDYVCPPSGEMVLFHHLQGPKSLTAKQNMGHGAIYGPNPAVYEYHDHIR